MCRGLYLLMMTKCAIQPVECYIWSLVLQRSLCLSSDWPVDNVQWSKSVNVQKISLSRFDLIFQLFHFQHEHVPLKLKAKLSVWKEE